VRHLHGVGGEKMRVAAELRHPGSNEFRVRVDLSKNIRKMVWSGR